MKKIKYKILIKFCSIVSQKFFDLKCNTNDEMLKKIYYNITFNFIMLELHLKRKYIFETLFNNEN